MLQRFSKIFYNMMSILVAIGCTGILVGTTAAFAAEPDENRTVFSVASVTVEPIEEDDTYFGSNAARGEWCKAIITGSAGAWRFSPYTYTVESFAVKIPAELKNAEKAQVYLDAPLSYSGSQSDDFVLTVYLHADLTPEQVAALLHHLSFTAQSVTRGFSEFDSEMRMNIPLLEMSEFPDALYEIKEPTKTAGSFF